MVLAQLAMYLKENKLWSLFCARYKKIMDKVL